MVIVSVMWAGGGGWGPCAGGDCVTDAALHHDNRVSDVARAARADRET